MANKLIIKFPFSSVNNEKYVLALQMKRASSYIAAWDAMEADTRCFTLLDQYISGEDIVMEYEGTLCGSVKAEDDARDDMFEPLCSSKLKFNIACQQFPSWLMDACVFARDIRVILYAVTGESETPLRVRWRGYLQCNTLNMTVVNDLLACPLVAIDEIGVAKHLPFRANCDGRPGYLSVYELFKKWWTMNWTDHFLEAYTDLGLATNQAALFFARDLCFKFDANNYNRDILKSTILNLERYYLNPDATWKDVLDNVCRYLGVHFVIGAYSSNYSYDNYIISSYDAMTGNKTNYSVTLANDYTFGSTTPKYATLGNQEKMGADLQVTYEPDKFKGVKVTSIPERPPKHDYLEKDNIREIAPASGHEAYADCRIGQHKAGTFSDELEYWRLVYTEIVDAPDQWTEEADYIELEDCNVSQEGRAVGGSGYFPFTDAPLGRNKPNGEDTDSIEFIMEKKGMIPIRLGHFDVKDLPTIPAKLTDYLMLLNNIWGRKYWFEDQAVTQTSALEFKVASIYPFGLDASILPADKAFLAIDFSAMILNENIGAGDDIMETTDPSMSNFTIYTNLFGCNGSVFPMTKSYHDYSDDDEHTTGKLVDAPSHNQHVVHFVPFLNVRLRIGNYFYYYDWDDESNRRWTYYSNPDDAPIFKLPLIGSAQRRWMNQYGYGNIVIDNYYYSDLHPSSRNIEPCFYVPLDNVSKYGNPLNGRVCLEIFWPTPSLNYWTDTWAIPNTNHYNNILSILIKDIDIRFTDEAEIAGDNIDNIAKTESDPANDTKVLKEVSLEMATPQTDGVFNNCLLYTDADKLYKNLKEVYKQTETTPMTFEKSLADMMSAVYSRPQVWVEFQRKFRAANYGNIANMEFRVSGLTEASGTFVPVERTFDFTKGWVRWKLQKLSDS